MYEKTPQIGKIKRITKRYKKKKIQIRLQMKVQMFSLLCWRDNQQTRIVARVKLLLKRIAFLFLLCANCGGSFLLSRLTPVNVRVDGDIVAVTYALEAVRTLTSADKGKKVSTVVGQRNKPPPDFGFTSHLINYNRIKLPNNVCFCVSWDRHKPDYCTASLPISDLWEKSTVSDANTYL